MCKETLDVSILNKQGHKASRSMECVCSHAAYDDHAHNESPVVISSYVSELELGRIGRGTLMYSPHFIVTVVSSI